MSEEPQRYEGVLVLLLVRGARARQDPDHRPCAEQQECRGLQSAPERVDFLN